MILPKASTGNVLFFGVAIILLFMLLSTLDAGAQDFELCEVKPDGSILCCETQPDGTLLCTSSISSTLTPFVPTNTPIPTATIVPTMTATPAPVIRPLRHVYLPIVSK